MSEDRTALSATAAAAAAAAGSPSSTTAVAQKENGSVFVGGGGRGGNSSTSNSNSNSNSSKNNSNSSSKEEFRRYLEQSDLLNVLTKALVTLYETKDDEGGEDSRNGGVGGRDGSGRPENAVEFLRRYLRVYDNDDDGDSGIEKNGHGGLGQSDGSDGKISDGGGTSSTSTNPGAGAGAAGTQASLPIAASSSSSSPHNRIISKENDGKDAIDIDKNFTTTIESLRRENARLQEENEDLRLELERMKLRRGIDNN